MERLCPGATDCFWYWGENGISLVGCKLALWSGTTTSTASLKKVEWCACLQPSWCPPCAGAGQGQSWGSSCKWSLLDVPGAASGSPYQGAGATSSREVGDASGQKLQETTLLALLWVSPVSLWGAPDSVWPLGIRNSLWFVLSLSGIMFAAASAHPWCMTGFKNVTGF